MGVESTYLLIKPYPFLTLNHLTVPKTFVAAMTHNKTKSLTKFKLEPFQSYTDKITY